MSADSSAGPTSGWAGIAGRRACTWPDGEIGPWIGIDADQFATIDASSDQIEPWMP